MENLTMEEYIRLLSGSDMWHTADVRSVPKIMMCDGPHGLRKERPDAKSNNDSVKATCFPTASALACSFDKELLHEVGGAIAKEAFNENVSVILGPGTNMKRNPLCGRNFEYFSEDPYLAGHLAASFINGAEEVGIGTSLKHFAANNQETNRMTSSSVVDERALREIYLRPFEYALRNSSPASVMASYNRINGVYSCENRWLLSDVLRKEWKYEGIVVSDWGASSDLTKSVKAGMNLEMPGGTTLHEKRLLKDLKKGIISEEEIRTAAEGVIRLCEKYEKKDKDGKLDASLNHVLAVKASLSSAVLLKNDGILPLKERKIIIIGALAENVRFQGGGSSHINTSARDALSCLKDKGYEVVYRKGYTDTEDVIRDDLENDVMDALNDDEVVLFFGGLSEFSEGEGYDRVTYKMPENQLHLLRKISRKSNKIIFISHGGAPYDMEFEPEVSAILQMYLGGEGVMEAVASLVHGDASPSGRLAESYPFKMEDTPSYPTFGRKELDVFYKESIFIGYRYYDTYNVPVRFPFGYGLSYTDFSYDDLKIEKKEDEVRVSFSVKNVGGYDSSLSVLLFIGNPECNYMRERASLKGFTKVFLKKGEERTCEMSLPYDAFSIYDKKKGWIIPSGNYEIRICGSVNEVHLSGMVSVEGVTETRNDRSLFPSYFDKKNALHDIPDLEFLNLYGKEYKKTEFVQGSYDELTPLGILAEHSLLARIILKIGIRELHKMMPGKPESDPEFMMMECMIREGTFDSVAVNSRGIIGLRLEDAIIQSANGHKFRALWKLIRG